MPVSSLNEDELNMDIVLAVAAFCEYPERTIAGEEIIVVNNIIIKYRKISLGLIIGDKCESSLKEFSPQKTKHLIWSFRYLGNIMLGYFCSFVIVV